MPVPSEWVVEFIDSGLLATNKATVKQYLRTKEGALCPKHVELSEDFPPSSLVLEFTLAIRRERNRRNTVKSVAKKKATNARVLQETYGYWNTAEPEVPEVVIGPDQVSLIFWNVHGLDKKKISKISSFVVTFDIVCLSETWILDNEEQHTHLPTQFNWFFVSALETKGHRGRHSAGQVIGVKKSLDTGVFDFDRHASWASLDVKINGQCHTIVSIYRRRTLSAKTFTTKLEGVIRGKAKVIVGGDFNVRLGHQGAAVADEHRPSRDPKSNSDGACFSRFLERVQLRVLNGQVTGDIHGQRTYRSFRSKKGHPQRATTIDYVCVRGESVESMVVVQPPCTFIMDHSALAVFISF